ncbi:MAG TPA: pyruvate kinase [Stellaceae bacterium]|jgi:pyruvate kinase|nr:pyruvate kinase [Stellaceae bacterium]
MSTTFAPSSSSPGLTAERAPRPRKATRRQRSAKIVATLGPASASAQRLRALFDAGVDVFRCNFSHGTHDDHRQLFAAIRQVEHDTGRPIGILADMQGPKLRLGDFAHGRAELSAGAAFRLDLDDKLGDEHRAPLPHPEVFRALQPGNELLVDDGKVRLKVNDCGPDFAETECVIGGTLSNHKGVNVPHCVLPISAVTDKDRADLTFALENGADWIALSFVQRPEDVAEGRKLVGDAAGLLVKLEKPSAIRRLGEIIDLADALMVARGDLGVEMPPEDVPTVQKQVIHACRLAGKPVIVATQMLESMINAPTPTRAEASDVATAVYEGADAVMLSAETAVGQYPVEAVAIMDRIARRVQADPLYFASLQKVMEHEHTDPDAISAAACQVAATVGAAAIVSYTTSGATALRAARERPGVPILVMTSSQGTARRLALLWGAHCVHHPDVKSFGDMVQKAVRAAHREDIAQPGQRVVITAGVPFGTPGATNILRIAWVDR